LDQGLHELFHAASVGPEWFTRGRSGQMAHCRMWFDWSQKALARLNSELQQRREFVDG
jgi:hypothetical protein